jgi:hypothetical protein
MLLWFVIAIGFVVSITFCYFWHSITWDETAILFISSVLVFSVHLKFIYDKTTTDHYIVSGYVTSLIHRPKFSYKCGKSSCTEPERWIIEQRPHLPKQKLELKRPIYGDILESCYGECLISYPTRFSDNKACCEGDGYAYTILVDSKKFKLTKVGETSAIWKPYFNPVHVSDEVIYKDIADIPYFKIEDFNRARRIFPPHAIPENKLEKLNSEFAAQNISVGLIITQDTLYFESLRRAWQQGKTNDFVVVIYEVNGHIKNVNVLTWNNYALRENIESAVLALHDLDINLIIDIIRDTLYKGPAFTPMDFSKYRFLKVKIPKTYYWKIFTFQILFIIYTLMLLHYNPNTKTQKLT